MAVFGDEGAVQNRVASLRMRGVVERKQRLADAEHGRAVAADLHLVIMRTDRGRAVGQHLNRGERVLKPFESSLADRIERDDRHVSLSRVL